MTAFLPTDAAFQRLVADIQHRKGRQSEQKTFAAVAGLGINTVESVLLYHVVPGATINRKTAPKSDGAKLTTAAKSKIKVDVVRTWHRSKKVVLVDADRSDRNPTVVKFDINKGNKQIAHAIDRVLRPIELP